MTPRNDTVPEGERVGLRKRYLPWLACAVVAAVGVPALASGAPQRAPGTINAYDFGFNNPATGDSTVTINAGETVSFSYPTGGNAHNVDFDDVAPTSCTQTAGDDIGPVPPLPGFPDSAGLGRHLPLQHARARTRSSATRTAS